MNEPMVNQQVTTHQLAWLAGIWDGEGSFVIHFTGNRYVGRLSLSNTCPIMINEIAKILDAYDLGGHIWQEEKSRKPNHKKAYHLTLNKLASVKIAIELMLPYLISKKARAEILLRFINSRLTYKREANRDPETGRLLGIKPQGYKDEEKSLYDQLRELNQTGVKVGTSETTR